MLEYLIELISRRLEKYPREFEFERRIQMYVETRRFFWKIDNFGLYFLTQTEPLESPPFQIAGVGPDLTFRLVLHKETRKKEMRVSCFLNVSRRHRAPLYLRIEGTVLLKLPNETTKIAVVRKPIANALLVGKTAWSHTIFPGNDLAVSVMCHLWRSPLFGSKHCSAVTLVKYQEKKLVEKLRLSDSFQVITSNGTPIHNLDECVFRQIVKNTYCKNWRTSTLTNCRLNLMTHSNIYQRNKITEYFRPYHSDKNWYLQSFFLWYPTYKNNTNYFKNNSPVYLKMEAEISLHGEFSNIQNYFSDSHPGTFKRLRHRLKNDLERFFRSNRKGCDLIFRCEKKDYPVHKSLICCKSTVFSKMFENDMKEKKFGIVEMDDTDSLTLSRFIEYLYLGSVTDSTLDLYSAMDLYAIAHRYSTLDLVNYSRQFLVLNMVSGNSDEMLHFADLYEDKSLKNMIDYCFYQSND
ncbi:hypothetical protein TNCV_861711 [Trichonephila clavipes]|nr:hypothetical protein TNCV_861711 [Trichonephila clavipes]